MMNPTERMRRIICGVVVAATLAFLVGATATLHVCTAKGSLAAVTQVAEKGSDGQETHG